jgi:PAS domain-containing protein
MRIKTQLLISIITFSIVLIIIGSSVALTQIQIAELNNQSVLTNEIQTGASDLNYISNNYFLYQDNSYITLWQTKFSTLYAEIAKLNSTNPQQQALVNTVNRDIENLDNVFSGVINFLSNAPRNVSIRVLPEFQTQWNRMAVQIQALAFDSQQLSQNIQEQANQAIMINTSLTVALLMMLGAFFITIYFVAYRKTSRSITKLKDGISVIGSGNLDYTVEAGKKDEIAEISKSVNQMAANLKTVTASKTDLEQAQSSLRESEQRWATTLASIGDAVIATNTLGKIVFMNREAEALTGWKLSEASQKPMKDVFRIINEQTQRRNCCWLGKSHYLDSKKR